MADIHIEHPNGSDGWLPAVESDPVRSSSKRKKPARHQQDTPPDHDDEVSKSRAVSADTNLTQKKRSKIAKSEGQS